MDKFTAWLDFCSVMFALGIAIYSRQQLRKGANAYEIKQNARIKSGNRVWWGFFCLAFGAAALSICIKYFWM
ncbi:hypothetical protein HFN78_35080 [Rhizobium laguerreae]|uniref:hypothetical protein n=1 Tax=Rhizobium laguerreae TaxID=1076926 RepID=UPI001C922A1F|nr:hypothetical protein [Rhizobium laguerreae]MBY3476057.1 hypothetical protein [Rhizobium laguerreae]MBY3521105.1 hypothetical protein [Rhizobium laguerreae]